MRNHVFLPNLLFKNISTRIFFPIFAWTHLHFAFTALKTSIYHIIYWSALISSSSRATSTDFPDFLCLSIYLYSSSLPTALPDYIQSPQRSDVDKLLLVGKHCHVRV